MAYQAAVTQLIGNTAGAQRCLRGSQELGQRLRVLGSDVNVQLEATHIGIELLRRFGPAAVDHTADQGIGI